MPTNEGCLCLAGHKDLFNGEIVGYAMRERLTRHLVGESLLRALKARCLPCGLIHQPDCGSQYCAHAYRKVLRRFDLVASMSDTRDWFDNEHMESFWGR